VYLPGASCDLLDLYTLTEPQNTLPVVFVSSFRIPLNICMIATSSARIYGMAFKVAVNLAKIMA
jgi:hypothetical protein